MTPNPIHLIYLIILLLSSPTHEHVERPVYYAGGLKQSSVTVCLTKKTKVLFGREHRAFTAQEKELWSREFRLIVEKPGGSNE